jgi:PPOX class probable F420-dependent enzyme
MPKPPLPDELQEVLARPNPSVMASVRPDGSPHSTATWYLWEEGRVLVNMDHSRKRLDYMRKDPRVSITVLDDANWYSHISLLGHVVAIEEDEGLKDIDRLSKHYRGADYPARDRARFNAWIEIDSWHAWGP